MAPRWGFTDEFGAVNPGFCCAAPSAIEYDPFGVGELGRNSKGTFHVLLVDTATGRRDTVAEAPGFGRGLVFAGQYAFIGLSKIRETSTFGGLPIAERLNELKCGVAVVDLRGGEVVGMLDFQTAVEEIFDVQLF